jgi:hypothetical protein
MPDELLMTPKYWRDRAEEARAIASEFRDKSAETAMLQIARGYDQLADIAKQAKDRPRLKAAQ